MLVPLPADCPSTPYQLAALEGHLLSGASWILLYCPQASSSQAEPR